MRANNDSVLVLGLVSAPIGCLGDHLILYDVARLSRHGQLLKLSNRDNDLLAFESFGHVIVQSLWYYDNFVTAHSAYRASEFDRFFVRHANCMHYACGIFNYNALYLAVYLGIAKYKSIGIVWYSMAYPVCKPKATVCIRKIEESDLTKLPNLVNETLYSTKLPNGEQVLMRFDLKRKALTLGFVSKTGKTNDQKTLLQVYSKRLWVAS